MTSKPLEKVYRIFGQNVRMGRKLFGISQERLGKKVGLTRTSIVNIEGGKQRILLHDVGKFAKALDIPASLLTLGLWPRQ